MLFKQTTRIINLLTCKCCGQCIPWWHLNRRRMGVLLRHIHVLFTELHKLSRREIARDRRRNRKTPSWVPHTDDDFKLLHSQRTESLPVLRSSLLL